MTTQPTTPPDLTASMVRRARSGDERAFTQLIEAHFGPVHAVALARLRDFDAAQDLTQEVFLRAHLHLECLRDETRFAAWVCRMARNLAIDWQRRGQRASRLLPTVPLEAVAHTATDDAAKGARKTMEQDEQRGALHDALDHLTADQREAVLLHFAEELSQRAIAEQLGVTQATVSRRIKGALGALRGQLEPMLRTAAPAMRPPRSAVTKSVAIALALGGLDQAARASLVSSTAAGLPAAPGGLSGWLSSLPLALTMGGKVMTTGKGLAAGVTAAALIGGGAYLATRDDDPPIPIPTGDGAYALTPSGDLVMLGPVSPEVMLRIDELERADSADAGAEAAAMLRGLGLPTVPRDLRLVIKSEELRGFDEPPPSHLDVDVGDIETLTVLPDDIDFERVEPGVFVGTFPSPPGGTFIAVLIGEGGPETFPELFGAWLEGDAPAAAVSALDLRSPSATLTELLNALSAGDRARAERLFADRETINVALEEMGMPPMTDAVYEQIAAERANRLDALGALLRGGSLSQVREDWETTGEPVPMIDNVRMTLTLDGTEHIVRFDEMVLRDGEREWIEGKTIELADGTTGVMVGHWEVTSGDWLLIEGPRID